MDVGSSWRSGMLPEKACARYDIIKRNNYGRNKINGEKRGYKTGEYNAGIKY